MMKYGKQFKTPKIQKNPVSLNSKGDKFVTFGATNKAKARPTWF